MQTNLVHVRSPALTMQARFTHAFPTVLSIPLASTVVIIMVYSVLNVILDVHSSIHNPVHSPDHGEEFNFYSIREQNRVTAPTSL